MEKSKFGSKKTKSRSDDFFNRVQTNKPAPNSDFFPQSSSAEKADKKVFNKSKWRAQKYSLKSKVDNWKIKRTEYIQHEYKKDRRRNKVDDYDVQRIYEEEEKRQVEEGGSQEEDSLEETDTKYGRRRKRELQRKEDDEKDQELAREEFLTNKRNKELALEKYRKEKAEKNRKLNKKTKKGQPVMKGRMELLLEQIQKNMNS